MPTSICPSRCPRATRRWEQAAATRTVNITAVSGSNCGWTVDNPCPTWITVSPPSGTSNGQVTITLSANSTGTSRACTLTVAGAPLIIMQAAGTVEPVKIQVDDASFGFAGGHFGFDITGRKANRSLLNTQPICKPGHRYEPTCLAPGRSISAIRNRNSKRSVLSRPVAVIASVEKPFPAPRLDMLR